MQIGSGGVEELSGATEIFGSIRNLNWSHHREAAFMLLVTCNAQGELAPLEIGLHALEAVGKAKGGRGNKGGLKDYARTLGKTHQYVSQLVAAAEVASEYLINRYPIVAAEVAKGASQLAGLGNSNQDAVLVIGSEVARLLLSPLLDCAKHLCAIHALPAELWPEAVGMKRGRSSLAVLLAR